MITRQKLHAIPRKAGHKRAEWHASAMVRGWGEWGSGYRIDEKKDAFHVWNSKDDRAETVRYHKTLLAAGVECIMPLMSIIVPKEQERAKQ